MTYVSVNVDVDVDLSDIDDEDLQEELDSRQIEAAKRFNTLADRGISPLVDKVRFAMYNKNEKEFLDAAKKYFYERYNVIGDLL